MDAVAGLPALRVFTGARVITSVGGRLLTSSPDIFLSYSREDQARAKLFADAFAREGFRVWWDAGLRTGETYDTVTERALRTAKAVVVLWSKRSVESRWVRAEATLADRNRTLAPAMIETCERPIMFELTQSAELSHWRGEASDPAFRSFLNDIRGFLVREPPAAPESTAPVGSAANRDPDGPPAIAVMPFANRSGLVEDEIFADGMVEDLIAGLSASRRLRVLSSGSTTLYRRGAVDIAEVGRLLGVRYLLEGNVRRVGETLRVTAQLVEAETGAILWTQKFDRALREMAMLQEELVADVAAHLGTEVERMELARALRKPSDLNVWQALLRFNMALNTRDNPLAYRLAQQAVEMAPDYAQAHAAMAAASGMMVMVAAAPQLVDRVRKHTEAALRLDADDPAVLSLVGLACALSGDPERGHAYCLQARARAPGLSQVHSTVGWTCMLLARFEEAEAAFDMFDRLAPRSPLGAGTMLGRARSFLGQGRPEEALQIADSILLQSPGDAAAQDIRVLGFARLGRIAEAEDAMRLYRSSAHGRRLEQALSVIGIQHARHAQRDVFLADFERIWTSLDHQASQ
jgi:TolB-like protein